MRKVRRAAVRGDHEKHDVVDDLLVRQALREHEGDHVAERRALPALQLGPPLLDGPSDGVPPAAARGEAPAEGAEGQVDRDRPDAPHQLLELRPELPPDGGVPPEAEDGRAHDVEREQLHGRHHGYGAPAAPLRVEVAPDLVVHAGDVPLDGVHPEELDHHGPDAAVLVADHLPDRPSADHPGQGLGCLGGHRVAGEDELVGGEADEEGRRAAEEGQPRHGAVRGDAAPEPVVGGVGAEGADQAKRLPDER